MTMRPVYYSFTPSNVSLIGIAENLTGAGPWDSSDFTRTDVPDGFAHFISLDSAANLSAINITITGTDADNQVISETLAGPNAAPTETTKHFKTVTAVSAASTLGGNQLDVGWADTFVSKTIPLETYLHNGTVQAQVTLTGIAGFDIEDTMSDIRQSPQVEQADYTWLNDANFTAKSASLSAALAVVARAIRLVVNSYTNGAVLELGLITPA